MFAGSLKSYQFVNLIDSDASKWMLIYNRLLTNCRCVDDCALRFKMHSVYIAVAISDAVVLCVLCIRGTTPQSTALLQLSTIYADFDQTDTT